MEDTIFCFECGNKITPDTSEGVWTHDFEDLGDDAFDLDEDHTARPEDESTWVW